MRLIALLIPAVLFALPSSGADRWKVNPDGGITWEVSADIPHHDHIEMSGLKVSSVLRYGVEADGEFSLDRSLVWPMLRTVPNNTHASLMRHLDWNVLEMVNIGGTRPWGEKVTDLTLDGKLTVRSILQSVLGPVALCRTIFPSTSHPSLCEKYDIKNCGDRKMLVEIPDIESIARTPKEMGTEGVYKIISSLKGGTAILGPGEEISFSAFYAACKDSQGVEALDIDEELSLREVLVGELWSSLSLETPDTTINRMFAFAKIRAAESIYDTRGGLMHGPGGESYYAAIWANDQAEYINPFFPFLGYGKGCGSALNSFMHFARYMNQEYKPIPSSIIAEGLDFWNGAGDRGDAAMIAYGAARYALARGDKEEAELLWPLIEWTLEYCSLKLNDDGVVSSDSDELEGRFPSGDANLCTSSLYYDALVSAAYLGKSLGKGASVINGYRKQAATIRSNIEKYFGAEMEGFHTYRYYKGNDVLRAWICIPLAMGIHDRAEGTVEALFSGRLWTENGLLSQEGDSTFWDRSTLYALRGVFECGETDKAASYLEYYSRRRLLGSHVPYAIEAWPEGGQRHLSAESGLYCRIITEGLFGIRPTGLSSFDLTPRLPSGWDNMSLSHIKAFGEDFSVEVRRIGEKLSVTVTSAGKQLVHRNIHEGKTLSITF